MILPFAKLGTLALKTICKPIAKRIKKEAGRHPQFRHSIINFAQINHRFKTKLQRRIYGHAIDAAIRPLNEDKAVQAAADLVGELFVFTVAGIAVILEVQRSSKSEARKEALRKQELETLRQRDEDLAREIEMLRCKVNELEQVTRGQGLDHALASIQLKAIGPKRALGIPKEVTKASAGGLSSLQSIGTSFLTTAALYVDK